mgnify:CR=1 FL=1
MRKGSIAMLALAGMIIAGGMGLSSNFESWW